MKKLNGEFIFIRAERNIGTSNKTGNPFDVSSLELSDGLESFSVNPDPDLVAKMKTELRKGDKIELEFEVTNGYRGAQFTVVKFRKVDALNKVS